MKKELRDLNVDVRLNTEIRALRELTADEIVVATGSTPRRLPVKGAERAIEACDYLLDRAEVGQRVIIIGGGLTGCEIALDLYQRARRP